MTVEWNGDVYPCKTVSTPAHIMGNLLRDTLDDIWNGEQFRLSRQFVQEYGPRQGGRSVCENQACALTRKRAV